MDPKPPDAGGDPAAAPKRPTLKLKLSTAKASPSQQGDAATSATTAPANALALGTPALATPAVATPSLPTPGGGKIKLKVVNKSVPPTPANETGPPSFPTTERAPLPNAAPPKAAGPITTKTKAGRITKPSAKKRAKEDVDSEDEPLAAARAPTAKRVKLTTKPSGQIGHGQVKLRVKTKGHHPYHPPGEGYDSEQEDRELDPNIEEQFILRYEGGDEQDLEYLAQMIEQGRIGSQSKDKPPAQFGIKWLKTPDGSGRRAFVRIRNNMYAAVLVDLPTITESMKTWDKKNLMKSADICQMLIIYAKVPSDKEARTAPLPKLTSEGDFKWPHGLTPPMHDAVQRRFRKRLTQKEVKDKQAELDRLLMADAGASSVRYEIVTIGQDGKDEDQEDADGDEDADGEDDDELMNGFGGAATQDGEDGLFAGDEDINDELVNELEGELEGMLDEEEDDEDGGAQEVEGATPMQLDVNTPAAAQTDVDGKSESEEDDDDDDDDDDDEDGNEDAKEKAADEDDANELLADAERAVAQLESELNATANAILRSRLTMRLKTAQANLRALKARREDDEEED